MNVRHRMKELGCGVSVHVYNALIASLERAQQWDQVKLLTGCLYNIPHCLMPVYPLFILLMMFECHPWSLKSRNHLKDGQCHFQGCLFFPASPPVVL